MAGTNHPITEANMILKRFCRLSTVRKLEMRFLMGRKISRQLSFRGTYSVVEQKPFLREREKLERPGGGGRKELDRSLSDSPELAVGPRPHLLVVVVVVVHVVEARGSQHWPRYHYHLQDRCSNLALGPPPSSYFRLYLFGMKRKTRARGRRRRGGMKNKDRPMS